MTPEEQAFWDAAFCAYVSGICADPNVTKFGRDEIAACCEKADAMLDERRKRTQKISASA